MFFILNIHIYLLSICCLFLLTFTCSEEIAEAHYLRAVVVLTEFVKELAACVQVKFCEPVAMEEPVDLLPSTTIPDNVDVSTPINDKQ